MLLFNLKVDDRSVFIAAETIMKVWSNVPAELICVDSAATKKLLVLGNSHGGGGGRVGQGNHPHTCRHTQTHTHTASPSRTGPSSLVCPSD